MSFYEDSSWLLIPSGIKEDVVYAQKPSSGLGDLVMTRASDATYTDSTGVVRRSPYNLVQFSEQFDNANWTKGNTTIGINTTTAPNGTITADSLIGNGVSTTHSATQSISLVSGVTYTLSFYAKADTHNFIQVTAAAAAFGSTFFVNFDVLNGTVGSFGLLVLSPSIQSVGDGWYRCSLSAISLTTSSVVAFGLYLVTSSTSPRLEVNTLSTSLFLWGAQVVEGTQPLDYFPTTNRQDVPRIDFRNADGTLSSCGRLLLEPQRTNSIRNSSMVGAVAGTPGTLPTNWSRQNSSGLTQTIVGTGVENGLPYIDINLSGTATAANDVYSYDNSIAASISQTWTNSWYFKLINSSPNAVRLAIQEFNSGAFLNVVTQDITPTTNLARYTQTKTLVGAGVNNVRAMIYINFVVGQTYNTTIRIAAPQMELGAYATTWVPTTTAAVTRTADTFTRNNIFTNVLISSAGGTWIVDLSNNLSLTRDGVGALWIGDNSTAGTLGNAIAIRHNGGTARLSIGKTVAGTFTSLFTTTTDRCKIAIKWNGTTADVFVNGVKQVSATSFTTTNMQFLYYTTVVALYLDQSFLAPTPLSDAECIQRTTL